MTTVSVCIINHNAKKITLGCLQSIYDKTKDITYEIILVDNGSTDGSVREIKEKYPRVKLIENKTNKGFAAANNQAIKISDGKYVILLNNDMILINNAFGMMVGFMDKNEKVGVLTCKLFEADRKNIQRNCRTFPSLLGAIFGRKSFLTKTFPNNPISKKNILLGWDYNSERDVDWVSGACMMIRREVLNQIGLLDENYFMYWEDTDFCKRTWRAGWKVCFMPQGEIIHFTGMGGGERALKLRLRTMFAMHKSAYYYFRKNYYGFSIHIMVLIAFLGMIAMILFKGIYEILVWEIWKLILRRRN